MTPAEIARQKFRQLLDAGIQYAEAERVAEEYAAEIVAARTKERLMQMHDETMQMLRAP